MYESSLAIYLLRRYKLTKGWIQEMGNHHNIDCSIREYQLNVSVLLESISVSTKINVSTKCPMLGPSLIIIKFLLLKTAHIICL